jgi:hypothetical protein
VENREASEGAMANITVRLTKRVKIIDAYSKDLLSEFSSRVSAEDFHIFLVTMTKMPWRSCPVVVDGSGRYNRIPSANAMVDCGKYPPGRAGGLTE